MLFCKAVLWGKLKGAQCSETAKSRVPSIWFVWKKIRFSNRPRAKVRCQGPLGSARTLPCFWYNHKCWESSQPASRSMKWVSCLYIFVAECDLWGDQQYKNASLLLVYFLFGFQIVVSHWWRYLVNDPLGYPACLLKSFFPVTSQSWLYVMSYLSKS